MSQPRNATRRHVLAGLGAALAAGSLPAAVTRAVPVLRRAGAASAKDPLFRISLAQWSLHRTLRSGELDALEFPAFTKDRFGIEAVEYVNQFFADKAGDFAWLGELRQRCADQGVRSLLIMIDGEGDLGTADDEERRRAIERHFKWIAAARFLGAHSIRVNARGAGEPGEVRRRAADSLHRLGLVGDDYGIDVIVENHGGVSSDGAWLAATIRAADHPRVGTLPDFGNFNLGNGQSYDRYLGVEELMPFARAVSAKTYEFDAAGEEVNIDYHRMMRIVVAAGYRGHLGIEYEGGKHSEVEGVRLTKALLERVRDELSAENG